MSDRPQSWHNGSIARWWAEFNAADPPPLASYRGVVERGGQPALDPGCGAGRLLSPPLVQAGLELDGCDVSPDILALCRDGGEETGLSASWYVRNDLLPMPAQAGIPDVEVRAAYGDAPATAVDTTAVFVARQAE